MLLAAETHAQLATCTDGEFPAMRDVFGPHNIFIAARTESKPLGKDGWHTLADLVNIADEYHRSRAPRTTRRFGQSAASFLVVIA